MDEVGFIQKDAATRWRAGVMGDDYGKRFMTEHKEGKRDRLRKPQKSPEEWARLRRLARDFAKDVAGGKPEWGKPK